MQFGGSQALSGVCQEPNLAFQLTPSDGACEAQTLSPAGERHTEHSIRALIGAAELHVVTLRDMATVLYG